MEPLYNEEALRKSHELLSRSEWEEYQLAEHQATKEGITITEEEFAEALAKTTKKGSKSKKKSKTKATTLQAPEPAPVVTKDPNVWQSIHFYTRPDATWPQTCKDARSEREDRSPVTVKVFAHEHVFGESCHEKKCKEIEVSDADAM